MQLIELHLQQRQPDISCHLSDKKTTERRVYDEGTLYIQHIFASYTFYTSIDMEYTTKAIAIKPPTDEEIVVEAPLFLVVRLLFLTVLSTLGQVVVASTRRDARIHACGSPFFTVTFMLPIVC